MSCVKCEKTSTRCSFCGKFAAEVTKLIAGPNWVFICNECVVTCVEVLCGGSEPLPQSPSNEKGSD